MNCPKCSTPAADGASHCRRCGTALSAKTAPSSTPDEIDLMPLEESKTPAYSAYEPPPGLDVPPPATGGKSAKAGSAAAAAADYVPKIRGANASPEKTNTNLIIGGVVLALLFGFVGWKLFRTKNELKSGKAKVETSVMLQPNQVRIEDLEVVGKLTYKLDVNALDSEIGVGVFRRAPKDPKTIAALKKLPEGVDSVSKGENSSKTGELSAGTYSWVLFNEGKKPARVKFKFTIE